MSAERRRWVALIVLCTGMLMIVLDATVVNVALSAIRQDLGFSPASLAWVVNAYMIAFGGLLLLAGRLGDLLGRRRIFLTGLAVFSSASLACGLAQDQATLVTARFVQGIGGAMTSAVILGMIVTMFPEPREQARAIGAFAFVASAGGAVGLLAGGVLTQTLNWHWIFFVNLPIGVVTALLALRLLDRDTGVGFDSGTDVAGAVTITAALMMGVYAIVGPAATDGWAASRTLEFGGGALGLLALFVIRELTAANPLMPLRIFRSRNVTGANLIQMAGAAGMFGIFFLGSLYLKGILGYDPVKIGLAFLPTTLLMGGLSVRFTEPLVSRFGARTVVVAGLLLITAGLADFTRAPVDGHFAQHVLPAVTLLGLGAGLAFPALMTLAMSGVSGRDAGLASGLVNTTAQVGAALGLAVLSTLSAARTHTLVHAGQSAAAATVGGYHRAFWVAAVLVGISVGIALLVLKPAPRSAVAADEQVRLAQDARGRRIGSVEGQHSVELRDLSVGGAQRVEDVAGVEDAVSEVDPEVAPASA
jgi:EmrB/QacA subfamily drug resistance transporter